MGLCWTWIPRVHSSSRMNRFITDPNAAALQAIIRKGEFAHFNALSICLGSMAQRPSNTNFTASNQRANFRSLPYYPSFGPGVDNYCIYTV